MSETDSTSSEGSSSDLDPTSVRYQPLRVLHTSRALTVVPKAKPYDNVGTFEAHFRQLGGYDQRYSSERLEQLRRQNAMARGVCSIASGSAPPVRRFKPHQVMIKAENPARFRKNIFTKLETMEGPLAGMGNWMREGVRVRIDTRTENGIRGYMTGYVEAFDKHWNMALSDVYESWMRRKYRYSKNKLCSLGEAQDCSELLRDMGIVIPEVKVKSVDRKLVECSRKVPKLMIRGNRW